MDWRQCAAQGVVGAAGAVPGTLAAHPFDVCKIRLQTGTSASALGAARAGGLYGGLGAAVGQKVLTRGPMFLASAVGSQICRDHLGMDGATAVAVGSLGSGYVTGSVAAIAEWKKVQGARGGGGGARVLRTAAAAGELRSVARRVHGAGCRNALFDTIFFGANAVLLGERQGSADVTKAEAARCYALSASCAVVGDYAVDVAVKRSMATPPSEGVAPVGKAAWALLRAKGWCIFRGLDAKTLEFGVSYAVTGAASVYVLALFAAMELET